MVELNMAERSLEGEEGDAGEKRSGEDRPPERRSGEPGPSEEEEPRRDALPSSSDRSPPDIIMALLLFPLFKLPLLLVLLLLLFMLLLLLLLRLKACNEEGCWMSSAASCSGSGSSRDDFWYIGGCGQWSSEASGMPSSQPRGAPAAPVLARRAEKERSGRRGRGWRLAACARASFSWAKAQSEERWRSCWWSWRRRAWRWVSRTLICWSMDLICSWNCFCSITKITKKKLINFFFKKKKKKKKILNKCYNLLLKFFI